MYVCVSASVCAAMHICSDIIGFDKSAVAAGASARSEGRKEGRKGEAEHESMQGIGSERVQLVCKI